MPFDSKTMRVIKTKPRRRRAQEEAVPQWGAFDDLLVVLPTLSVAEVIELIEAGEADIADVKLAERVGKARKTVLSLVKSESGKVYPISKTVNNPFAE
jgi:hypothetical protein